MTEPEDADIIDRAQELSHAFPLVEFFQPIADEVDGWWADGFADSDIDQRILVWTREQGWEPRRFVESFPPAQSMTDEQRELMVKVLRFDEWTVECVKAIARTGKPLPFIYGIGDVFVDDKTLGEGGTLVWAVGTAATNPETIAKKFVRKCKDVFGAQVTKDQKPRRMLPGQLTPAEAFELHRQRLSYRDIAIQNLRHSYPDIIEHPHRHRERIKTERERVRDEIATFAELWGKRLPGSPTDD